MTAIRVPGQARLGNNSDGLTDFLLLPAGTAWKPAIQDAASQMTRIQITGLFVLPFFCPIPQMSPQPVKDYSPKKLRADGVY